MLLVRLFDNWPYKLVALAFAIILHLYAVGQVNPRQSRTFVVPLTPLNLPTGMLADEKAATVAVTLEGPADEVNSLSEATVAASTDLSHALPGKNAALPVQIILPLSVRSAISVTDVQPSVASVVLIPKKLRVLPILASDPGTPPIGYTFHQPVLTPREATIEGRRDLVNSVVQVVAKVDTGGVVGTVDDVFPLIPLDAHGSQVSDVTITPLTARVKIMMLKIPAQKSVFVSPAIIGAPVFPGRVLSIEVKPQTLNVAGRPEQLAGVTSLTTEPVIDVTGATADITRQVRCLAPPGVTLSPSDLVTVTVHITAPAPPAATAAPPPVAAP